MSSEPIERRVSYIGDRLRGSQCAICGKEYFRGKNYCGTCGRKSFGKMKAIDFFYDQGVLEVSTVVNQPTNRFVKMGSYSYGIVAFHEGKTRVPGRITDALIDCEQGDISCFDGKNVVPRFRRRYTVGESDVIPTVSLAFSIADGYYPHQKYEIHKPKKQYETPGIVGYGVYTSKFRIKEGNMERSVPFIDEDAVTAAVEAGKMALIHSGVDNELIGKIYVGSESNPYAVNPIASKVAQVLKLGKEEKTKFVQSIDAIDTEFACKAATSMFKDASALVYYPKSNIPYAMAIGADNSQSAPRNEIGGELDHFVGFGSAAFIFGMQDIIAEVEGWYSCTSDTPDFWRRDMQAYPRHGGRFTGKPAYFKHVQKACKTLMEQLNLTVKDVDYFVPHQPNPRFPVRVAKQLGFNEEQFLPSIKVTKFGNTYSGAAPIGLAAVLDVAKPDQRIVLTSYGSGAGSDAYSFLTTKQILEKRNRQKFTVDHQIENEHLEYVDYHTYRRLKQGL
ncbi:MAG: hydroxymethylglutaryl-CoA synthase [Candidatus Bathyarchaeota archaeon]|nr:hydroxymethylglutaryl-CoA synthase [Candidatus Bathyarchaeota archaeon]